MQLGGIIADTPCFNEMKGYCQICTFPNFFFFSNFVGLLMDTSLGVFQSLSCLFQHTSVNRSVHWHYYVSHNFTVVDSLTFVRFICPWSGEKKTELGNKTGEKNVIKRKKNGNGRFYIGFFQFLKRKFPPPVNVRNST